MVDKHIPLDTTKKTKKIDLGLGWENYVDNIMRRRNLKTDDWENKLLWKLKTARRQGESRRIRDKEVKWIITFIIKYVKIIVMKSLYVNQKNGIVLIRYWLIIN